MSRKNNKLKNSSIKQSENITLDRSSSSRQQSKQAISANIRVVQTNLVYAIGLHPSICQPNLLQSKTYFGKYGNVIKVIINKQQSSNQKQYKNPSLSAYITYDNQISAALAVIGLFQWKYQDKIIRCCFGASKYCQNYFKSGNCRRQGCVFLHKRNKDREIQLGQGNSYKQNERQCFQKQLIIALQTVFKNRKQIIKKHKHQQQENQKNLGTIFPNVYSLMKILIHEKYIDSLEYEAEWQQLWQPPLKTCYSQSTQCSPIKQIQQYEQQSSNPEKIQLKVIQKSNKQQQPQQIIGNTLEELINKSIISKLLSKQKYKVSQFKFARGNNLHDQNIKMYIEKFILNEALF